MENNNNNQDIKAYQKKGFIRNLPFGIKAEFIKYWFYGAVYFFCFMGLGLAIKDDTWLSAASGLIAGALFDIALYNIYLLIEDDKKLLNRWWFFKNRYFYSIFINVAFELIVFFLFHLMIVPIHAALGTHAQWLFKEPLSAGLFLLAIDTLLIWIKNLLVKLFKMLFMKKNDENPKKTYLKVLNVSPVSVTIELNNSDIYYASKPFNVLLDGQLALKKVTTNVFTIYDLMPDRQYKVTVNHSTITINTTKVIKAYKVFSGTNLQNVIDNADMYSLIVVNEGTYKISFLDIKSNITIYLRKGATLLASSNENDYPIIPSIYPNTKNEVYGNFEGEPRSMRKSIISMSHVKNVSIIGEGIINGNADKGPWWKNPRSKIARPHLMFINHSSNINIIGIKLMNSPQWTIHPFFSSNINFYNLYIENPEDSPNTDGINPQCSNNINILGVHFSVGDDCVTIKSGKKELAEKFHTPCSKITIRNCLMENGHGGVVLGSENASGISSLNVSRCLFINTDRGLRIKTRRGRGKEAIIDNVIFENILMKGVLTPLTINMFYNCDSDGNSDYVQSKKPLPVDDNTPYLGKFIFKNITALDYQYAAGFFYGLPEKYIGEVKIVDSFFKAKDKCEKGSPIMMKDEYLCSKNGFIVKNVKTFELNNTKVENVIGKEVDVDEVSELIIK